MKLVSRFIILTLIFNGVYVHAKKDANKNNPDEDLRKAIYERDVAGVQRALSKGANPNAVYFGDSHPLMEAASVVVPDMVKILLKAGANVNAKNQFGYTAVAVAAEHKDINSLKLLVEAGADVNIPYEAMNGKKYTPLSRALEDKNYPHIIQYLKDHGAK